MEICSTGQRLLNIHDAVRCGDTLELEAMVKRGASINEVDAKSKFTAIHWACHTGALEVCRSQSLGRAKLTECRLDVWQWLLFRQP